MKHQRPTKSSRAARRPEPATPPGGDFFISGRNGVRECLQSPHVRLRRIWANPSKADDEMRRLLSPVRELIEDPQGKHCDYGPIHQGVAAVVSPPTWPDLDDQLDQLVDQGQAPLLVALDQVEDPMNLGQILRTCEGAGVHGLLIPKHRSVQLNQTVAQVSQGAFAWLPLIEIGNLRATLDRLKERGLWVIGCDAGPGSKSWRLQTYTEPTVFVLGAEGKGLRDLTRKTCDVIVQLPMKGHLDSLNVGAATAALVFEAVRQRESLE